MDDMDDMDKAQGRITHYYVLCVSPSWEMALEIENCEHFNVFEYRDTLHKIPK